MTRLRPIFFFFFFNDTATTEIYTLSLHDALPIFSNPTWNGQRRNVGIPAGRPSGCREPCDARGPITKTRSEEHTSELQSRLHLVCRLLLEKKKQQQV